MCGGKEELWTQMMFVCFETGSQSVTRLSRKSPSSVSVVLGFECAPPQLARWINLMTLTEMANGRGVVWEVPEFQFEPIR